MENYSYKSLNLDLIHKCDNQPNQDDYVVHTHIVFQVCLLLSGACIYHVEGSVYPMQPGDIVLTFPQEVHYVEIDPQQPCNRMMLSFGPEFFKVLDPEQVFHRPFINREAGQMNHYPAASFPDLCFEDHFNAMISNGYDRFTIITHILQLFQSLNTAFDRRVFSNSPTETLENRVIRYINRNLRSNLTTETLCEKFFISKAQLYRIFKKATGTTVSRYVETKRMLSARQMILDNERITRICSECGFRDYSTFYRAYQRYFGHSPREERHNRN